MALYHIYKNTREEFPQVAPVPANPKIFHITHVQNLPQIMTSGVIWSDKLLIKHALNCKAVGMSHIKQRRLNNIEVTCHRGTKVGDYAPFYFCPRSIMLYIIHMGNHPDLDYKEGQQPIVHLQADLMATIRWADENDRCWAFSNGNASAHLTDFFNLVTDLDNVNWDAVQNTDFRDPIIKEGKQAEFLLYESFPWTLIEKIGVISNDTGTLAHNAIAQGPHQPPISIKPTWYY